MSWWNTWQDDSTAIFGETVVVSPVKVAASASAGASTSVAEQQRKVKQEPYSFFYKDSTVPQVTAPMCLEGWSAEERRVLIDSQIVFQTKDPDAPFRHAKLIAEKIGSRSAVEVWMANVSAIKGSVFNIHVTFSPRGP